MIHSGHTQESDYRMTPSVICVHEIFYENFPKSAVINTVVDTVESYTKTSMSRIIKNNYKEMKGVNHVHSKTEITGMYCLHSMQQCLLF